MQAQTFKITWAFNRREGSRLLPKPGPPGECGPERMASWGCRRSLCGCDCTWRHELGLPCWRWHRIVVHTRRFEQGLPMPHLSGIHTYLQNFISIHVAKLAVPGWKGFGKTESHHAQRFKGMEERRFKGGSGATQAAPCTNSLVTKVHIGGQDTPAANKTVQAGGGMLWRFSRFWSTWFYFPMLFFAWSHPIVRWSSRSFQLRRCSWEISRSPRSGRVRLFGRLWSESNLATFDIQVEFPTRDLRQTSQSYMQKSSVTHPDTPGWKYFAIWVLKHHHNITFRDLKPYMRVTYNKLCKGS